MGDQPTATKIVIVDSDLQVMDMLIDLIESNYNVIFEVSSSTAYSKIREIQPQLVVICAKIDVLDGFQLLSMLKLDPETSSIPVLTFTDDRGDPIDETDEEEDDNLLPIRPAMTLH